MQYADEVTEALIADWRIGDRVRSPLHATDMVPRLRSCASTGLQRDALVEFTVPTTHQHWTMLVNLHRLAPGESDCLPNGLRDVNCSNFVHHT